MARTDPSREIRATASFALAATFAMWVSPGAIFADLEPFTSEAIERGLGVMDSTALSLCMDHDLPIYVFNMAVDGNMGRIVSGERVGTLVSQSSSSGEAEGLR